MSRLLNVAVRRAAVAAALAAAPFVTTSVLANGKNNDTDPGLITAVKPYGVSYSIEYVVKPILSVGEPMPLTSDSSKQYQMIGIPDGMGADRIQGGKVRLWMNHELNISVQSQPIVDGPIFRGAFVSEILLSKDATVISGDLAYDVIYDYDDPNETRILPLPTTSNDVRGFARFCSGSLAYRDAGFDRPFYFCGEESGGAGTFDGKGGLGVVIFDRQLHTMPWIGRFPWENTLARPKPGRLTVLMGMEDGPATTDNQLYMWVGEKDYRANCTPLERNGMARNSGKLYVLVPEDPADADEAVVTSGSINAKWVALENVEEMTDVQLEAASDAVGAFGFVRTEDGAFDKKDPNTYYFVTTGSGAVNALGRLYKLELNRWHPTGPCKLTIIYNADELIAAGEDIAISPDNIDTSKDYIMICEDGTTQSRAVMATKGRDGQIWRLDIDKGYATLPVVELNPPGTIPGGTGIPPVIGPGVWETTGIIDGTDLYGKDTWLFNVQAHGPSIAPGVNTVEDGQLLIMLPVSGRHSYND